MFSCGTHCPAENNPALVKLSVGTASIMSASRGKTTPVRRGTNASFRGLGQFG
jgi:hypothetical protein